MLILDLHDLYLQTFPEGQIMHRIISPSQAKKLIERSINKDEFLGTYKQDNSDLKRAGKDFREFIEVMKKHGNIELPQEKFFEKEVTEDGLEVFWGNTPGLFTLGEGDALLVVDYGFEMLEKTKKSNTCDFRVAPETIKFHEFRVCDWCGRCRRAWAVVWVEERR